MTIRLDFYTYTTSTTSTYMSSRMVSATASNGHDEEAGLDEKLLRTISDPSSTEAYSTTELARSMGIDGLPTKEVVIEGMEKEILAPIRDLSGAELWRWQT